MSEATTNPPATPAAESTPSNPSSTSATPATPTPADPAPITREGDKSLIDGDPPKDPAKGEAPPFEPLTSDSFQFADGAEINEEALGSFLEVVNEHKLPKEAAQALVDLQTNLATQASEEMAKAWETMQEQWQDEARKHPDFGGDKLAPTLAAIKNMVNEVMGDKANEVFEVMAITGAGNNPHIIGLMSKLAKDYAEAHPAPATQPAAAPADLASRMFPNQGKT